MFGRSMLFYRGVLHVHAFVMSCACDAVRCTYMHIEETAHNITTWRRRLLQNQLQVSVHRLRRRALAALLVQLKQRLRHLEHLRVHPCRLHDACVHEAATSRAADASDVLHINEGSCLPGWARLGSSGASHGTALDKAHIRGALLITSFRSHVSSASHGCSLRSVSAAATTMQPMAMRYGACTRLTSVRYESFSTALPHPADSVASQACNGKGPMP